MEGGGCWLVGLTRRKGRNFTILVKDGVIQRDIGIDGMGI